MTTTKLHNPDCRDPDPNDTGRPSYGSPDDGAEPPPPPGQPRKRPRRFGDPETLQRALEADEAAPFEIIDRCR